MNLGGFRETPADQFHRYLTVAARGVRIDPEGRERRYSDTVHVYTPDEYGWMKCYTASHGNAGFALKNNDGVLDLVSVFSISAFPGDGARAIQLAVALGAQTVDVFDEHGFLPSLYGRFGFGEVGRDQWDDQYAPAGWTGGTPDVVYMEQGR